MGVGRFICVALPFGLTICSMIAIIITITAGITNKNLDLFQVNTQNLSISASSLANLEKLVKRQPQPPPNHFASLTIAALTGSSSSATNLTAADLGLADTYLVSLWAYCAETGTNKNCTKAKFNWADSALNTTSIQELAIANSGVNFTLPKTLTTALHTFTVVNKWTEVVYIIAFITCAVELFFGIFAICSRVGSCLTFIVSGLSTVSIVAASVMSTVLGSITVGSIESVSKAYGVSASLDTSFLATTWIAAAFSIAGGLFWMFTICCCAADHHSKKNKHRERGNGEDAEKLIPQGAYQRVEDTTYPGQQSGVYQSQGAFAVPTPNVKPQSRGNGAYEPFSHAAV